MQATWWYSTPSVRATLGLLPPTACWEDQLKTSVRAGWRSGSLGAEKRARWITFAGGDSDVEPDEVGEAEEFDHVGVERAPATRVEASAVSCAASRSVKREHLVRDPAEQEHGEHAVRPVDFGQGQSRSGSEACWLALGSYGERTTGAVLALGG
jgi:hypothetical protein